VVYQHILHVFYRLQDTRGLQIGPNTQTIYLVIPYFRLNIISCLHLCGKKKLFCFWDRTCKKNKMNNCSNDNRRIAVWNIWIDLVYFISFQRYSFAEIGPKPMISFYLLFFYIQPDFDCFGMEFPAFIF